MINDSNDADRIAFLNLCMRYEIDPIDAIHTHFDAMLWESDNEPIPDVFRLPADLHNAITTLMGDDPSESDYNDMMGSFDDD